MTGLGERVPVEPLAPGRVARIEENVIAAYRETALSRPSSRRAWAVALRYLAPAAAVCGVAFAIFLNLRAAGQSESRPSVAVPGELESTKVETGAGEITRLDLGDAVVAVGAETSIEIARQSGGEVLVRLLSGRVDCEVEPREERAPFVVRAGDVAITVVGTAFSVERDDDSVHVQVNKGRVRVDSPQGQKSVAAGEEWSGPVTRVAMADVPAQPETAAEPDPLANIEDPEVALPDRRESRVPAVSKNGTKPAKNGKRTPKTGGGEDAEPPGGDDAEPPRDFLPKVPKRYLVNPAAFEEEESERVRKGKGKGTVGKGGTEERQFLYREAYLELFVRKNPRAAIETERLFRRRFQGGDFTEEMFWIRSLAATGGESDAASRKAASEYLRRFPKGKYRQEARDLLGPL